jgi:hypothetical protein
MLVVTVLGPWVIDLLRYGTGECIGYSHWDSNITLHTDYRTLLFCLS